eukprot:scaffold37001_cov43-Prasinocladus_malaysianus.AAC.1
MYVACLSRRRRHWPRLLPLLCCQRCARTSTRTAQRVAADRTGYDRVSFDNEIPGAAEAVMRDPRYPCRRNSCRFPPLSESELRVLSYGPYCGLAVSTFADWLKDSCQPPCACAS